MSVTVDQEALETERLGLSTVGQLLAHVQRDDRLVVNILIDGREPDIAHVSALRRSSLHGHVVFIETAEPRQMALDVLSEVEQQLGEADRLKDEAVDLLQRNAAVKAMEKLSGCFSTWRNAQESVLKTAQLLRIDLEKLRVKAHSLRDFLTDFSAQLRQMKTALESRDFVTLSDILIYESTQTSTLWRHALGAMRDVIAVK